MSARCLLLLLLLLPCTSSVPLSSSTADPGGRTVYRASNTSFTHLTVHTRTGEVYVGAVNRVLKLSSNLTLQRSHMTGPVEDNNQCYPPPNVRECAHGLNLTDNVNKLLLIDYSGNSLIACGSIWQGVCQFLRLKDLFKLGEPYLLKEHYLSGGQEADGMTGLIDPENRVYIGRAVHGKSSYFPSLSYHKLVPVVDSMFMFSLVFDDGVQSTQIKIPSETLDQFPNFDIHYVYAFSSGSYVYFLTVQLDTELTQNNTEGEEFYTSKIVRMCSDDVFFNSYVEFPLGCTKDGVKYHQVQAAFKQKPGRKLAQNLGLQGDDDVLFVVFSKGQRNRTDPSRETALCLFTLQEINQAMKEKISGCYKGIGHLSLPWLLNKDRQCINTMMNIGDPFCGLDINSPLGSLKTIEGHPVYEDRTQGMGAVVGYTYGEDTVVFVGTKTGQLKKIRVDGVSNSQNAQLYETVVVEEGKPILRDLLLSPDQRFIYVLNDAQVTRLSVETCNQHSSCSDCLGSGDPHCGWCVPFNKCSRSESCEQGSQHFNTKLDQCVNTSVSLSN